MSSVHTQLFITEKSQAYENILIELGNWLKKSNKREN